MKELTCYYVPVNDLNVSVSVGSGVFVPEADDVSQLVDDDAELVAILADGDGLGPVATPAHERAAPVRTPRGLHIMIGNGE